MSTDLPLVSVGVPVYNGEGKLEATLQALIDQDYQNLEIIVSDNASTDQTAAILEKFAAKDSRIRPIRQTRNIGAAANFVQVLEQSKGEYFMWAASGDYWSRKYVGVLAELLRQNAQAVLAVSHVGLIDGQTGQLKNEFWHADPKPTVGLSKADRILQHLSRNGNDLGTYGHLIYGLFRRHNLRESYRMLGDTSLDFGTDVLLLLLILSQGGLAVQPERILWYRTGGSSTAFRFEDLSQWMEYRATCARLVLGMDLQGLGFDDLVRVHQAQMKFIDQFTGADSPYQASLIRQMLGE